MNITHQIANLLGRQVLRARLLRNRDFTIVSNNCWGAHIYQQLGRSYQTPFIGVFLAPACYVNLVSQFRWHLSRPIRFVSQSRHANINGYRKAQGLRYPIGCLGDDVEIQFLHYESESEAAEKWNRRLSRVSQNDAQLFFKFCDRDGCTPEQLAAFDAAPVVHKVCFVSRPAPHLKSAVWIPNCDEQVPDGLQLSRISPKYFDAADWINGSDGRSRWWHPLRRA